MFSRKTPAAEVWLVVGLGNPDAKYNGTRHNAGFTALDYFCEAEEVTLNKRKFNAVYGEKTVGGVRIIAAKPQTYMNLSGEAVSAIAHFYKIPPERVVVFSDDVSLPVGHVRVRAKGSAGGHNGLKNIIALLGSENFARVRVGVGEKPNPEYDLADWVLGKIPAIQLPEFTQALKNAAAAAQFILKGDIMGAMNRYNG